MARKYTPRPQPAGRQSTAPKPHERRASGAYPYYRVAQYNLVSLTFKDNAKPYDTAAEAKASVAHRPGTYRLSTIHADGTITGEEFTV